MVPIYILGSLVGAYIWSAYDAHFKRGLNEWGEVYNPDTDTWGKPVPITIPEIELNERGQGIVDWFSSAFDMADEKKAIRNYVLLAIILYTKPWK
ncbi:MAG: hypothetical protein [Circular genetic element sp.]|nr:MAG: hypothetical protein [Circular genetic element sp.]